MNTNKGKKLKRIKRRRMRYPSTNALIALSFGAVPVLKRSERIVLCSFVGAVLVLLYVAIFKVGVFVWVVDFMRS